MMIELTFEATRTPPKRSALPPLGARPTRDGPPEIGRRLRAARSWRATNRGLEHVEDLFAAVAFVGLLAIGTLTFGYAIDGLTAAHATAVTVVSGT